MPGGSAINMQTRIADPLDSMQLVSAACEKRGAGGLMDAVTKVFLLELQLLFII